MDEIIVNARSSIEKRDYLFVFVQIVTTPLQVIDM